MGFSRVLFLAVLNIFMLERTVYGDFNYPNFPEALNKYFIFKNSNIVYGALQVTAETANPDFTMENKSGRVLYDKAYRFWREDGTPVSFNTTFVLNIQVQDGSSGGEGMAFIITSNKNVQDKPEDSQGLWLGLFNSFINGSEKNEMVAVEFDTVKNNEANDPDDNHVGVNVNSINSKKIKSLNRSEINLKSGNDITVWIQFQGDQQQLQVYMANGSSQSPMPSEPLLSGTLNLSTVLRSEVRFGFSASTGENTELNCVKSWSLSIEPVSTDRSTLVIILSVVGGFLFVAAVVVIVLFLIKYRKLWAEEADIAGTIQNLPGHPREFKYKDLKKATQNFSAQSELGSGGFGSVHKALLHKDKTAVAVKRMFKESKQGKREFISEISIINQLRHRNLVPLLGWCHHSGQLMMVYEYMPNGSLEKLIYQGCLDWEQRYNILLGVASALLYLHEECEQQVIHRDLKASNIMLDSNYDARLGDFGLARLIEHNRTSYTPTDVAGTPGYIAPECFHTGRASVESDVFGFGAVVLEVVCGRSLGWGKEKPDLVGWVWELHRENRLMEAADCRINLGSVNEEDVKSLLVVGMACLNPNPVERPTMRQVKQMLYRELPPPFVPPFRPPFVWPYPEINGSSSTAIFIGQDNGSMMNSFMESPAVREEENSLT